MRSLGFCVAGLLILSFSGCGEINIIEQQTQEELLDIDLGIIEEYRIEEGITFEVDTVAYPIQYQILDEGTGKEIHYQDIIFCDYILKLTDGEIFHTSIDSVAKANDIYDEDINYKPAVFTHTETGWAVTPILAQQQGSSATYELGWKIGLTAALKKMNVGGHALIVSPSNYAYQSFNPFFIPDYSVVIYEVFIRNAK
ncbi:MAG: FKBP-type peptidyl-prolyl cis-trans isomerase [Bacteroidota bacterium]